MPPCSKVHTEAGAACLLHAGSLLWNQNPHCLVVFIVVHTKVDKCWRCQTSNLAAIYHTAFTEPPIRHGSTETVSSYTKQQCKSSPEAQLASCLCRVPLHLGLGWCSSWCATGNAPHTGAYLSTLHTWLNHSVQSALEAKPHDRPLREQNRMAPLANSPVVVQAKCRRGLQARWIQLSIKTIPFSVTLPSTGHCWNQPSQASVGFVC